MLWLNTVVAQPSASFQQYYYYYKGSPVTFAPIVTYQFDNKLYFEGRYNYEDVNTASLYVGRTFDAGSDLSISFTPIAGAVFGFYKGASLGANLYVNYKRLNLSHQPQYTLSVDARENNFLYSWSDLSLDITNNISVGVSAQHTKMYSEKGMLEKGVLVQFSFKNWSLPVYTYNPESSDRYFLIGLNYEWEGKKSKKQEMKVQPDFTSHLPALGERGNNAEKKEPSKPQTEAFTSANLNSIHPATAIVAGRDDNHFALLAGSFKSLEEAQSFKNKIINASNKQACIYTENSVYKVRLSDFKDREEAERFRTEVLGNFSTGVSVIYAYRVKDVELDLVEKVKGYKRLDRTQ